MDTSNIRVDDIKAREHNYVEPGLGVAAVALTSVTAFALLHPHPLVLPLLSIILVTAALGLSGIVYLRHRGAPGSIVDRLHLAGLMIFFGFAAAMLGDPDPAVKSLDALAAR